MNTSMEKSAISLYDLVGKSLFVESLDSFRSTRFSDDQIRDKLTIHFQNRKLSHGGDVKEVIYPLPSAKGCAVVVFEDEKDLASVVKLEQIFYGQFLKVDELPPIFSSVRAEIHPFYFKIMPTDNYDKILERFERVADVKVDRSNCSKIACLLPSQLDRVGEEVVRMALGELGQSLSNTNGKFEAAGACGADNNTGMAFRRDPEETYPEDAERRMSMSEEEPERSSGLSVEMKDLEVDENQGSRERITRPKTSDDNEEFTTSSVEDSQTNQQMQEQDIISLDKNVYKYIQVFDGPALDKLLSNYRVKRVCKTKSQENVEAVILPTRAGVSAEDIKKARDDFIEFYQKAFYSISRKRIDCSTTTKGKMKDAAKKTQNEFQADTLILPVDGSPMALLILTRGSTEEVARKFRGYAGIKSGKSLRSRDARDVPSASQDVTTTAFQFKKEVPENNHPAEEQQQQVPKSGIPDDHPWDFMTDEGIGVYIRQDDITKYRTDAVVIPSQPDLSLPTGGVAGAVWSAAGPLLQNQCHSIMAARRQRFQTAECVVTHAFNLNMYHSVIHAVIPYGSSNTFLPDLSATFHNCLRTATAHGLQSLAIPLMGSGLSRAPKRECADALVCAILNFSRETRQLQIVKKVLLVNNDFDSAAALQQSLQYSLGSPTGVPDSQPKANYESRPDLSNAKDWPNLPQSDASKANMVSHPQSRHDVSSVQGGASGQPIGATVWLHSKHAANVTSRSIVAPASKWPDTKNPNGVGDQPVTSQPQSNSDTVGGEGRGQPKKETTGQTAAASDKSYGNQQANQGANAGKEKSTTEADLPGADQAKASDNKPDECPICLDAMVEVKVLPKCKHAFCKSCIKKSFETTNGNRCPVCRMPCGEPKGNQPDGTMKYTTSLSSHLPGYPYVGTIIINYDIPDGIQSANHPNPGQRFQGDRRTAYLPYNAEGREVLALLRKAFDARLVFTVGLSVTSGADNVVTWNDIHHKTSQTGGPQNYGYPDPDYLRRVKQDIAAKGIV